MAYRTAGRKGARWRRVQAQVYAEETHCVLCGRYVDQTLANYRCSQARSVHHLVPPDIDPDLANDRTNCRLAHLGCNSKYGRGAFKGDTPSATQGRTSRGRTRWAHPARVVRVATTVEYVASDRDW